MSEKSQSDPIGKPGDPQSDIHWSYRFQVKLQIFENGNCFICALSAKREPSGKNDLNDIKFDLFVSTIAIFANIYTLLRDDKQHDKTLDSSHSWNDDDTPKRCAFKQPSFWQVVARVPRRKDSADGGVRLAWTSVQRTAEGKASSYIQSPFRYLGIIRISWDILGYTGNVTEFP